MPNYKDQLRQRRQRLILTFLAKKYVAWFSSTLIFLLFVGVAGWAEWLTFTAAIFCIDAYSKTQRGNDDPPAG